MQTAIYRAKTELWIGDIAERVAPTAISKSLERTLGCSSILRFTPSSRRAWRKQKDPINPRPVSTAVCSFQRASGALFTVRYGFPPRVPVEEASIEQLRQLFVGYCTQPTATLGSRRRLSVARKFGECCGTA
jgi:hypothetical protein